MRALFPEARGSRATARVTGTWPGIGAPDAAGKRKRRRRGPGAGGGILGGGGGGARASGVARARWPPGCGGPGGLSLFTGEHPPLPAPGLRGPGSRRAPDTGGRSSKPPGTASREPPGASLGRELSKVGPWRCPVCVSSRRQVTPPLPRGFHCGRDRRGERLGLNPGARVQSDGSGGIALTYACPLGEKTGTQVRALGCGLGGVLQPCPRAQVGFIASASQAPERCLPCARVTVVQAEAWDVEVKPRKGSRIKYSIGKGLREVKCCPVMS